MDSVWENLRHLAYVIILQSERQGKKHSFRSILALFAGLWYLFTYARLFLGRLALGVAKPQLWSPGHVKYRQVSSSTIRRDLMAWSTPVW